MKTKRIFLCCLTLNCSAALLLARPSLSAPCCGGASAIPSLITGDNRAQFAVSVSQSQVIGDAPPTGAPIFRADGDTEETQTLHFSGAYLFSDRLQAGFGIPLIRRTRDASGSKAQSTGLGDIQLDLGYEFLTVESYSPWKPHGFLFLENTLPTGPSVYDARENYLIDARGRGFYSTGLGVAFVKAHRAFDFTLSTELHRSFARTVTPADGSNLELRPGWGASALAGVGWSPNLGNLRIGASLSPVYEGAIHTTGDLESFSDSQLVWNSSFQLGYLMPGDWSGGLSYVDQTLMGPAKNVSLSRTLALSLSRRWEL